MNSHKLLVNKHRSASHAHKDAENRPKEAVSDELLIPFPQFTQTHDKKHSLIDPDDASGGPNFLP